MKIFLTGATGFIGKNFLKLAKKKVTLFLHPLEKKLKIKIMIQNGFKDHLIVIGKKNCQTQIF